MQIKNKKYKYLNAKKLKGCIVVSRWNLGVTKLLLENALDALQKSKMLKENIEIVYVSGSVEIPFALQKKAQSKEYDFLVAIGCVVRGDTPHFDYVCKMAQEGVLRVSLDYTIPIGFSVLTLENIVQAQDRIIVGGEASLAAVELALL